MYPVALIIMTGAFLKSSETHRFVAPFAWFGTVVAIYHNLVYYKVIEVIVPCSESAPCTAEQLNYLGFVTIPLLSLAGFTALVITNFFALRTERKGSHEK